MQETQETQVQSLGWEDALQKGMATHSSILAWRIPWTEGGKSQTRLKDLSMHACKYMLLYLSGWYQWDVYLKLFS